MNFKRSMGWEMGCANCGSWSLRRPTIFFRIRGLQNDKEELQGKIEEIQGKIKGIQGKIEEIQGKIEETEQNIDRINQEILEHEGEI